MVWLGWLDSNQRMRESKSRALPLGYTPIERVGRAGADAPALSHGMGWVMGLEPTTPGTTIRCSYQLSYTHHSWSLALARQEGLEPPAYCLEGSCSILLSYWRISRRKTPGSKQCHAPSKALLVYHPRPGLSRGICNFPGENRHAAQFFCASASRRRISRVRTRAAATARMTSATSWA